jgi:hypothetical protein
MMIPFKKYIVVLTICDISHIMRAQAESVVGRMDYTVEYYEREDGSRPAEEFILSQDNKCRQNYL